MLSHIAKSEVEESVYPFFVVHLLTCWSFILAHIHVSVYLQCMMWSVLDSASYFVLAFCIGELHGSMGVGG